MAQLATLLGRVHDEIPAAPELLALRALVDAVKEFCVRSHYWRDSVTSTRVGGGSKFLLTPPVGVQVAALLEVRNAGRWLEPVAPFDRRMYPHSGEPRAFAQWTPAMIELDITPMDGTVLDIFAALTLSQGASGTTDVPAEMLDEYGEAIAAGAKMRLLRQTGQPWHNPDASVGYAGQYYNAIADAKRRAMTALGQADLRVEMRPWV